jgi:hypothetical protein
VSGLASALLVCAGCHVEEDIGALAAHYGIEEGD